MKYLEKVSKISSSIKAVIGRVGLFGIRAGKFQDLPAQGQITPNPKCQGLPHPVHCSFSAHPDACLASPCRSLTWPPATPSSHLGPYRAPSGPTPPGEVSPSPTPRSQPTMSGGGRPQSPLRPQKGKFIFLCSVV